MKVWVVIEEDRGCGVSVVGVYYNKDNVILHSHEYLYESEIHDAPGNAQQVIQPDAVAQVKQMLYGREGGNMDVPEKCNGAKIAWRWIHRQVHTLRKGLFH